MSVTPHTSPEANTTLHPATDNTVPAAQFSFIGGTFVGPTAWGKKTVGSTCLISGLQVLEYVNIEIWIGYEQLVTQSY